MRALGVVDDADLEPLRRAAAEGRDAFAQAFLQPSAPPRCWPRCCRSCCTKRWARRCPKVLPGAAALWGLAQKAAMTYPEAVRRAGHADGNALFDAILSSRSGRDVHRPRI